MRFDPPLFRRFLVLFGLLTLVAATLLGCPDDPVGAVPCGTIPALGCPDKGQECRDPTCASLYKCLDGVWRFTLACDYDGTPRPPREASAPVDAGYDPEELKCPPLEEPDCPRSRALACPSGCCSCEDVFRCVNAGWELAGGCVDGGLSVQ